MFFVTSRLSNTFTIRPPTPFLRNWNFESENSNRILPHHPSLSEREVRITKAVILIIQETFHKMSTDKGTLDKLSKSPNLKVTYVQYSPGLPCEAL